MTPPPINSRRALKGRCRFSPLVTCPAGSAPLPSDDRPLQPALLAPADDGRSSRLSAASASAPVQCVCVFVGRSVGRHCRQCKQTARCHFATAKTVGFVMCPVVLLTWGAFWVTLILLRGGML